MTQDVMLALLNRAADGNELLAVLDTLTEDVSVESDNQPTLEHIEFWYQLSSDPVPVWLVAQGFPVGGDLLPY